MSFTNNKILSKYPTYTNWTVKDIFGFFNFSLLSSPLFIDDKNIAFITESSSSNCPTIYLWNYIYDLKTQLWSYNLINPLKYQTDCSVSDYQGKLFDIGGNMIALKTDYSVFIL